MSRGTVCVLMVSQRLAFFHHYHNDLFHLFIYGRTDDRWTDDGRIDNGTDVGRTDDGGTEDG